MQELMIWAHYFYAFATWQYNLALLLFSICYHVIINALTEGTASKESWNKNQSMGYSFENSMSFSQNIISMDCTVGLGRYVYSTVYTVL